MSSPCFHPGLIWTPVLYRGVAELSRVRSLAVAVEDATSSCCVTVKVVPHMTVASLKQQVSESAGKYPRHSFAIRPSPGSSSPLSPPQMFAEYGFHPRVQRWVIGQCLCSEQRSLASYGVCRDGDTAFLYLLSARHARLSRLQCQQDQESVLLAPAPKPPPTPAPASHDWRGYSTLPPRLHHSNSGAASLSALSHRHRHHSDRWCSTFAFTS